jgi:hypothetical protein
VAEPTPETLLALLAVKLLGGKDVSDKAEAVKALKKFIQPAVEAGWLAKGELRPFDKKGNPKAPVPVVSVTPAGEEYLQRSSAPEAAAVHAQLRIAELRKSLEADRADLREQVLAAVKTTGKKAAKKADGQEKPGKNLQQSVDELLTKVTALADRISKLESAAPVDPTVAILAKIDSAFQALAARLSAGAAPTPPQPAAPTPPAPAAQPSVRDALRAAYDKRCLFVGNEDGVVKLADLYAEAKRVRPDLTVEAMHRELRSLWESRELELSVLNELHDASEPDKEKGIWRDGKLYYFIYWKRP